MTDQEEETFWGVSLLDSRTAEALHCLLPLTSPDNRGWKCLDYVSHSGSKTVKVIIVACKA